LYGDNSPPASPGRGRAMAARLSARSVKKLGKFDEEETYTPSRGRGLAVRAAVRSIKNLGKVEEEEFPISRAMWHHWSSGKSRRDRDWFNLARIAGDLAPWSSNYDACLSYGLRNQLYSEEHELPIEGLPVVKRLYMNKEFSDVKIFCEDQIFDCNKCILSCQSDVFKRMLMDNITMAEATSGEITIKGTSALTMNWLLYFMYQDDLPKTQINGDLLIAADKFNVSDLVAICVNYLTANLNENNVVDAMVASYLTNQKKLFEDAYIFLFKCRIKDKEFKTEAWEEMKKKTPNLASDMMAEAMFNCMW